MPEIFSLKIYKIKLSFLFFWTYQDPVEGGGAASTLYVTQNGGTGIVVQAGAHKL